MSVLAAARNREASGPARSSVTTVAVTGAAGAPGVTSVALHLAHALARHQVRTMLVDADSDGGFLAHWMGRASGSIPTLVNAAQYGPVGAAPVIAATEPLRDNLRLLAGFDQPQTTESLPPDLPGQILEALDGTAQFAVVDCGRLRPGADGAWQRTWLDLAHGVLVVVTPDTVGAVRLGQIRPLLEAVRAPAWRHSVVNRFDRRTALAGFEDTLRRELEMPMTARIPRNDRAFDAAVSAHRATTDRAISRLFDQLAGVVISSGAGVAGEPS